MKFGDSIREIGPADLVVEKPWIRKLLIVISWMFAWGFISLSLLRHIDYFEFLDTGEPSVIFATFALFGLLCLFIYWTVSGIYFNIFKDRTIRITSSQETLTIRLGKECHIIKNTDIAEIRLKKIVNSQGGHSLNLSVVTKESQYFVLIKSTEALTYELADRISMMTNASISVS